MAILQGFLPPRLRSTSKSCSPRCARRCGDRAPTRARSGSDDERRAARDEAERLWPVSADRSLRLRPGVRGGIGTPVKAVLRKLMRWYVEPLAYDQRSFNAAALRLIDDLQAQVDRLEAELETARSERTRIAVLRPQVPFARGGAEIFTDRLVEELRARGHEADLVSVPFKWYPGARVLTQAFLWRLLDLDEADGKRIDLVVATKFPSYLVRHSNKRVWLVHQFRQAYELDGTPLGQFDDSPEDRALRRKIQDLDRVALGEAERLFATSRNVARRLEASTGLSAEILPHPPQDLAYRCDGYGDFVLSVNRLDRAKRIDLLLEAAALDSGLEVVIAGRRPGSRPARAARARSWARRAGAIRRSRHGSRAGRALRRCLAVYYAPVDEDFGMVPFEAFLAEKPVLTTTDAGGPLEVVADGKTGVVVEPEPADVARATSWLRDHRSEAAALGRAGKALAAEVTWERAIARLLA